MQGGNRVIQDADGRHWLAIVDGVRFGGFETEGDARRFLLIFNESVRVPYALDDGTKPAA